jgi:SAM-dependent methyltransferase
VTDAGTTANAEQREYWNSDEGAIWVREQDRYDEMLAPFTPALLDAAPPGTSDSVLDVGCGSGATTIAAARLAGDGRATGNDISEAMIGAARRRAEREGVTNATFAVRDAQTDALDAGVDLVMSRFGVMFFDDPAAAFTNLRRALTPGGRIAFVCWQPLFVNEWMTVPALAVAEHVPLPEPPAPGTPGPFSLGDPDLVRTVLGTAGFGDVSIEPFETSLLLGGVGSVEDAVTFLRSTGMGRTLLSAAPTDVVDRALGGVRDALAPHHDGDGVRLASATWIVSAVNS